MVEERGRTWLGNRQKEYMFEGDFFVPVGATTNSMFTHALHGRLLCQTVPKDMGRMGIREEGRETCGCAADMLMHALRSLSPFPANCCYRVTCRKGQ